MWCVQIKAHFHKNSHVAPSANEFSVLKFLSYHSSVGLGCKQ